MTVASEPLGTLESASFKANLLGGLLKPPRTIKVPNSLPTAHILNGILGNAALLHRYGFTEQDNSYDIVNIDMELVLQWCTSVFSDRHSRARVSLWRKLGYSACGSQNSEYFEISFDGEPQIELLVLLHIMFTIS